MFIRAMRIVGSITGVTFREINFHKGANIVVDMSDSDKHNKVGKTTLLKLIDIMMGARDKKYVYTDSETGSVSESLRAFIEGNQIAVEMTLVDDFDKASKKTELRVDLFPRGGYYIDSERVTLKSYQQELNLILFENPSNVPTFRQLINSFVRVSVGGDDDSLLKTLPNASIATYRAVYNHLFGISDPMADKAFGDLKAEKKRIEEAEKRYKRVAHVDDINGQEQILLACEREYAQVKLLVDDIVDANEYLDNRDAISAVRKEYLRLTEAISELEYQLLRAEDSFIEAKNEQSRCVDDDLYKRFYDEVGSMLPAVDKTFSEMISFNERLCANKVRYLEETIQRLKSKKCAAERERSNLVGENKTILSLIVEDRLGEYEGLSERLSEIKQDIGRQNEIIETLRKFKTDLRTVEDQIDELNARRSLESIKQGYQSSMDTFNSYFTPLAQKINGEKPLLIYHPDANKFPVSISDLSGTSTGTRKSLIVSYDLAYQYFSQEKGICCPKFIVHDVVESIEGDNLRELIAQANGANAQYIVAILKEKLDSSGISEDDQRQLQIVRLSDKDKLFEGKGDGKGGSSLRIRLSVSEEGRIVGSPSIQMKPMKKTVKAKGSDSEEKSSVGKRRLKKATNNNRLKAIAGNVGAHDSKEVLDVLDVV